MIQSGIVMLYVMTNHSTSTGLILLAPTVGISETWLQTSDHNCDIMGYISVHSHRKNKTGGGVCLYLDSALEFITRYDLSFNDLRIESLFVEICCPRSKNIILGIVYRPPD